MTYSGSSPMIDKDTVSQLIQHSFSQVAPFWPLDNLIAVNPLQGLENHTIEEALKVAYAYFQHPHPPLEMESVNRESIKWIQAYLDEGQATLGMPLRDKGVYASWRQLAIYDEKLYKGKSHNKKIIDSLSTDPTEAIAQCLSQLMIPSREAGLFLTLMLTTLAGWTSYVKYRTQWARSMESYAITQEDYLALRIVITRLLWPHAKQLLSWYQDALRSYSSSWLEDIKIQEASCRTRLLTDIAAQRPQPLDKKEAQFIFCIDVRSEPFRTHIESMGAYETFGCAGFFGLPLHVHNTVTQETYASCPVLLSPQYQVDYSPCSVGAKADAQKKYGWLTLIKQIYQETKRNFVTPFALAEIAGIPSAAAMGLRSLLPQFSGKGMDGANRLLKGARHATVSVEKIPLSQQCTYALTILRLMGMTTDFAPKVIVCGHGSHTVNNAYASALDCGACGGRHGGGNALALATILNNTQVRQFLAGHGIVIPDTTQFIAAQHNTTTDEMILFTQEDGPEIQKIKQDLEKARQANALIRYQKIAPHTPHHDAVSDLWVRSRDWAQVRPEWGLARNCAFIIAPRGLTRGVQLDGRCFLHSYDYAQDPEGASLEAILTAPMIVTQWINAQYLFSTLDNVAYGGGSKITKNVVGKLGIMQGNASDLMTGLPLQSVYITDTEPYHSPQRLMTVVFCYRHTLDLIIAKHENLKKLFSNGWVQLTCIEPDTHTCYWLERDLSWRQK